MGAKESVEAAKFSSQNWNNFEHAQVKHPYRHSTQRSQSLNRGHSLSRTDGTW